MQRDAVAEELRHGLRQSGAEFFHCVDQFYGSALGAVGRVRLRLWRAPVAQERVAKEMLQVAFLADDGAGLNLKNLTEQLKHCFRAEGSGQGGGFASCGGQE